MTIIYQYKVASASFLGFFRLLKAWRGSVYKLIYKETIVFCVMYAIISLVYRLALNATQRRLFEQLVAYCNIYTNLIPVSFVLGFYVSLIVGRWWTQFMNVPWPDRTLYIMGSYLVGRDENSRMLRRTVARYMLASLVLILRSVSVSVMKRYPTMEHIVDAGFLTPAEVGMFENVNCKYNKFWVPLVWANTVLTTARREGIIESEYGFKFVLEQIADFRDRCSTCFVYDWITIPLVYTQVVTLAVYMFFGACLIGRQYVENVADVPDLYIPFFTLLQFLFYMGWLKVAEQLINPFGEDDDDFDMNWLLDRHFTVAMNLVDYCHSVHPPLVKDVHFDEVTTDELPYTEAAMASRRPNFMGSTYNLERPSTVHQRNIANPETYEAAHMHHGSIAGLRKRSNTTGRVGVVGGGSSWSLFGARPSIQKFGSRGTLSSLANGHPALGPLNFSAPPDSEYPRKEHRDSKSSRISDISFATSQGSRNDFSDLPPEYVPLRRARTASDADHTPLRRLIDSERERKWSFPLSLLKRHSKAAVGREFPGERGSIHSGGPSMDSNMDADDNSPLLTPGTPQSQHKSRFTVEVVPGDHEVDASKSARNKQIIEKHMSHMAVSRPPVLSAIEEGNTIRSVKEILTPSSPSNLSLEMTDETVQPLPATIVEEGDDVFSSGDEGLGDLSDIEDTRFSESLELPERIGRRRLLSESGDEELPSIHVEEV
ncbi:BEST3-like protein [Mya arenaria]|uniref:Bestrophin homolog n=1 Tax=Mya arenaria TaxID=6604 RepID=A0ABY7E5E7_MYAAR|nr:bestrophin-4-like [Mya arenaria]WAR05255.1 BEST3-like protein [Mya arenaria]